jgi:hypothetical protein
MKYIFTFLFFLNTFAFAADQAIGADCIILNDENSIVCKYTHQRVDYDKEVLFQWVEPDGVTTRKRVMSIPAYHGSVYDYRYMEGRAIGEWKFKVIDGDKEYNTSFVIK